MKAPQRTDNPPIRYAFDKDAVIATLNRILELELAGVVHYTHYALMVYGFEVDKMLRRPGDAGPYSA